MAADEKSAAAAAGATAKPAAPAAGHPPPAKAAKADTKAGMPAADAAAKTKPAAPDAKTGAKAPAGEAAASGAPPIEIIITPGGVIASSEDLKALDDFQELLEQLAAMYPPSKSEITVFYLKYAKAVSGLRKRWTTSTAAGRSPTHTAVAVAAAAARSSASLRPRPSATPPAGFFPSLLGLEGGDAAKPSGDLHIVPDVFASMP